MADISEVIQNIQNRGMNASYFPSGEEAAEYLNAVIDGVTVGIGGSMTVQKLGLYQILGEHNTMCWHWEGGDLAEAAHTEVYLSSVNALAETGELVNIDGTGNRIASTVFGHKKVFLLVGENKITPDLDSAIHRARNVAAPLRAKSMGRETPCAKLADRCYDCRSPQRICNGMTVLMGRPFGIEEMEVLIIGENLGM